MHHVGGSFQELLRSVTTGEIQFDPRSCSRQPFGGPFQQDTGYGFDEGPFQQTTGSAEKSVTLEQDDEGYLGGQEWEGGDYSDFSPINEQDDEVGDDLDCRDFRDGVEQGKNEAGIDYSDFSDGVEPSKNEAGNGWGLEYDSDEGDGATNSSSQKKCGDNSIGKGATHLGDCGCITAEGDEDEDDDVLSQESDSDESEGEEEISIEVDLS